MGTPWLPGVNFGGLNFGFSLGPYCEGGVDATYSLPECLMTPIQSNSSSQPQSAEEAPGPV